MNLDRFFKRRPGLLFLLRLAIFGLGFSMLTWFCLEWGKIPGRGDRPNLSYDEHPIIFTIFIVLFVFGTVIATTASVIAYLKSKKLLATEWKLFGLDFRG